MSRGCSKKTCFIEHSTQPTDENHKLRLVPFKASTTQKNVFNVQLNLQAVIESFI